jgi:hypothetical protein
MVEAVSISETSVNLCKAVPGCLLLLSVCSHGKDVTRAQQCQQQLRFVLSSTEPCDSQRKHPPPHSAPRRTVSWNCVFIQQQRDSTERGRLPLWNPQDGCRHHKKPTVVPILSHIPPSSPPASTVSHHLRATRSVCFTLNMLVTGLCSWFVLFTSVKPRAELHRTSLRRGAWTQGAYCLVFGAYIFPSNVWVASRSRQPVRSAWH